jgi:hypothetical protein
VSPNLSAHEINAKGSKLQRMCGVLTFIAKRECEQLEPNRIDNYWKRFAEAFAQPLQSNGLLGSFISNPCVTGAYAEAWVQWIAQQMVTNLTISTGAITRTSDSRSDLRSLPQIDLLLWDHTELPALFCAGNFALVHTQAGAELSKSNARSTPALSDSTSSWKPRNDGSFRITNRMFFAL